MDDLQKTLDIFRQEPFRWYEGWTGYLSKSAIRSHRHGIFGYAECSDGVLWGEAGYDPFGWSSSENRCKAEIALTLLKTRLAQLKRHHTGTPCPPLSWDPQGEADQVALFRGEWDGLALWPPRAIRRVAAFVAPISIKLREAAAIDERQQDARRESALITAEGKRQAKLDSMWRRSKLSGS